MGKNRDAVDTITGYYYQFDFYILQLLKLNTGTDSVCIEGIEDVDIKSLDETTAIQCKYYSKTEYNHSVIAKPIRYMLTHYKNNREKRADTNYRIYGNFASGQNKLPQNIDIFFVKEHFLTYTQQKVKHEHHKELRVTDEEICNFITHISIDVNAVSYEDQEKLIITKLKELFKCSEFEAEYFYYTNAIRLVKDLATKQSVAERTISQNTFKAKINNKSSLFNCWYLEHKEINKYCKSVKSQYFSQINISPYERFFLIDCDNKISEVELKTLMLKISKNWSKLSKKDPKTFCPYIYLNGATEQTLINIKKSLHNDSIYFLDGYDFKGSDFSLRSITRKATGFNDIKLKFITESTQLTEILNAVATTRIIYQFFIKERFFDNDQYEQHSIQIKETKNIELIV